MRMNGKLRSEIGEQYLKSSALRNVNLLVQVKGEVQKVENEKYVINVSDEIEGNWCIYDNEFNESFAFYPMSTRSGIMFIACNGISYIDNNDPSKNWGFMFSENDTDIYSEIMQAIIEGSIKGGMESVSGWEEWFKERGGIFTKEFSRMKNWLSLQMRKKLEIT